MTCQYCAHLDAEQDEATQLADLTRALRITVSQAKVLLALYDTGPKRRVLSVEALEEAAPSVYDVDERGIVARVHVHRLRSRLGRDVIVNERGLGYRISEQGRALVSQILEMST